MIPIVQPIQMPVAANADLQSNQMILQQSSPQQLPQQQQTSSPVIVIPAFGQPQSGGRMILIQPVSASAAGVGSLTAAGASAATSSPPPADPPSPLTQPAIMIMASGSSPINRYAAASGAGGGSKKRKKKSNKRLIILNLKDDDGPPPEGEERHKSCSLSDEDKLICREKGDSNINPSADVGDRLINDAVISEGHSSHVPVGKDDADRLADKIATTAGKDDAVAQSLSTTTLASNRGNSSTPVLTKGSAESTTIAGMSGVSKEQSPLTTPLP